MNENVAVPSTPDYRYCGPYAPLDDFVASGPGRRSTRIAILTQDIFGPVRNAGIGTAYMHAATFLAERGFRPTIIYTQGRASQTRPIQYWIDFYAERGVKLICAVQEPNLSAPTPALAWSFNGFRQLAMLPPFDIVHSSECGASPYYALLAKRNRGLFADTAFCIKTSSPHLWSREGNDDTIALENGPIIAMAERYCVEQADLVIAPSRHMLDWMQEHSYTLPRNVCVHPNIMPLASVPQPAAGLKPIDELVFFGRLEPRKGIRLFAEAVELALPKLVRRPRITFLGKVRGDDLDFNFDNFLAEFSQQTKLDVDAITDRDAGQAIGYLKHPGRLAVIPSLLDNSPFTVYEALVHGFPFIASSVGGIPELVHPDDRGRVLFAPRASALASQLCRVMERGIPLARLSFHPIQSLDAWERFHLDPAKARITPPELAPASAVCAPAVIGLGSNKRHAVGIEALQEELPTIASRYVFLHHESFAIESETLASMATALEQQGADIAIPSIRALRGGNEGLVVNLQPTMWMMLEFSRFPTVGIVIRKRVLAVALEHIAQQPQIAATSLDEIVAAAARCEARISLQPDVVGRYDGLLNWTFNRAQRNRQIRMLSARLPADIANIFRVYGGLQDERSRLAAAQPVLNNLRRLIRIYERSRKRN